MPLLEHRWRVVVERVRQRIISAAADRSPRLPDSERAAGLPDRGGGIHASNQLNEATPKVGVLMSMGKPLNPRNQSSSEGQASFSSFSSLYLYILGATARKQELRALT